ncbi:tetratricopeptide repeat protein [Pseudomonas sp. Ant30-3]|uniref:tetratricopeptide repeat protein n=1 Tax=Pseudomonas sp. Ant30-3 TaxID=1488328 RepID=UPI00048D9B6E|nr:hypothetical protein [Pseudomonas sp. Ant30-3]
MNKIFVVAIMVCSMYAYGDSASYPLTPDFNSAGKVEFTRVEGEGGQVLEGSLITHDGHRKNVPDTCKPEGGSAELVDAYTVKAKATYFLFTCAWPVQHSGIGLNGIQYDTYVYTGKNLASIEKNKTFSQRLSGYEGSLEEGGISYAWYVTRKVAEQKLKELEAGDAVDSLMMAHAIVLTRLKDGDYQAIQHYLSSERIQQLRTNFPVSKSTLIAYNDLGYALGESNSNGLAYKILKEVETIAPDRVVLKINIADVLWSSDKEESKRYYKEYVELMRKSGKSNLIPAEALERSTY